MNRFNTTRRGYKYDKVIFWFVMVITLCLVFYLFNLYSYDFNPKVYFKCESNFCDNPYYTSECKQQLRILFFIPLWTSEDCKDNPEYYWLTEKTIPRGEYGDPPPKNFIFNYIKGIIFLIFIVAFLLNHFAHNKGKPFDIEIPITKKIIINRDTIFKK